MGGKKKKGKKGKAKKEKKDDDEEEKIDIPKIELPKYGWIRLTLKLCDAPIPEFNEFRTVIRSDKTMMDVKNRIVEYHGHVDNITLYNRDPYPERNKKNY